MGGGDHDARDTFAPRRTSPGNSDKISLSPRDQARKIAFRELIEAVGGFEAAALNCRLGKSQLHRCASTHCPDFAPIDVVQQLEAITRGRPGWPVVTRLHARDLGMALVALPTDPVTPAALYEALAAAIREANDVSTGLIAALGDGVCTPDEAAALLPECLDAAAKQMKLHALLAQIAGEA
jgi:hypothetical protein